MNLAILQARTSSSRLPGKVMAPLLGEPMIVRQVERLRRAKLIDKLMVATSDDPSDDVLAACCEGLGLVAHRGPLHDVLGRFSGALAVFPGTRAMIRLTADCPLADSQVIDEVIARHLAEDADYTSNTLPTRTYPHGLDVEVVRPAALQAAAREATDPYEREHVTPFLYRRPDRFRLAGVARRDPRPDLRWTVDYPADLAFVREVYAALYPADPGFGSEAIIALARNSAPVPDAGA